MKTIITIGRERGSGGKRIGQKLAEYYNIPFYDKELLEKAASESGLCKELFENHDEKPTNSFLYSLVMGSYAGGAYGGNMVSDMPLNQRVFLAQFDVIKKIAEEGPCVIIGRCADYALDMNPDCLSVFVHANTETRIKRIANELGITNVKAREIVTRGDKERASYYNYYTNKRWGDSKSYNLCIDSSIYGIDGSVEIIKHAVELKENGNFNKIYELEAE